MRKTTHSETNLFILITGVAIIIATLVSLCIGKYPLSVSGIFRILGGHPLSEMDSKVFYTLRLPRTAMAILAGFGLGIAGNVYQTIFRNPLASPDIIGISSGTNLGAAVAIVMLGSNMIGVASGAFVGGLVAVFLVILLVRATNSNTTTTYVLGGIIISSVAKAFIMLLKYYADSESQLATIEYWTMGSLASVTGEKVLMILPFWLIGVLGITFMYRQVTLLALNEDECRSLGVRIRPVRLSILLFSTLLVASIICITGLIAFLGLIAPHIAGMMSKQRNRSTMVLSGSVGATVMLISDILARSMTASEIPISILTTIIGVPVLVYFMCKKATSRKF